MTPRPYIQRKPGDPDWVDMLREIFTYDPTSSSVTRRVTLHRRAKAGETVGVMSAGRMWVTVMRHKVLLDHVIHALWTGEWREQADAPADRGWLTEVPTPSGVKGVIWNARMGKWQVVASLEGRRHHLGFFADLEAAKVARSEGVKWLRGVA